MWQRYTSVVVLVMAVFGLSTRPVVGVDFYTAAVYEHVLTFVANENITSRDEALNIMNKNLDVLEYEAGIARSKGADIFVFPEYGITNRLSTRLITSYYVEMIPNPASSTPFCPCSEQFIRSGQEVLHRLSCIAQNNSMYIAANMGDKQPCLGRNDVNCPFTSQYQYNTEVVFDRQGCLVAKYHKQHLFELEKLRWDEPPHAEISYFDTDFGRFGLMICFDAVFKSPAVDLIERHNVTDIIFSTAWMNVYPHYISTAYHSGWARTMSVNYLASNIHYVPLHLVGSGVYSPNGIIEYTFNKTSNLGSLVIAKVPINKHSNFSFLEKSDSPLLTENDDTFKSKVFHDEFTFVALTGLAGNVAVCSGSVCCYAEFTRSNDSESYALGVFNGMHYKEGQYYLEICLLVRCSDNHEDCGVALADITDTRFLFYNLTGVMNTKYAFPEVVSSDLNFTTDWEFENYGYTKTIAGTNKKIGSVVLMGRNFDKDIFTAVNSADFGGTWVHGFVFYVSLITAKFII